MSLTLVMLITGMSSVAYGALLIVALVSAAISGDLGPPGMLSDYAFRFVTSLSLHAIVTRILRRGW